MRNKIISVFPNTDLRCSHDGLTSIALKSNRNPEDLNNGSFYLFLNRKQSMFKMMAANNTLIHHKAKSGRVDIHAIEYLPSCFNAGKLDYDKALETVLKNRLRK